MPLEGHGWDCDCGCCDIEAAPTAEPKAGVCLCPSCGTDVPQEGGVACVEMKCPRCGAAMKPKQ